ncbi:hypothetical protein GCM10023189_51380 [Nibrella saemangeumensis]|uniref:Uncharacterized protein n=1 Tax=Nibrella saemangeumensis TaxID=1084526 RepID=A0ABP8NKV8_9BACT
MRSAFLSQPTFRFLAVLIIFLLTTAQARSQSPVNYLDPSDPDRGYWKLHTDHATRNTIVRLYNSGHKLVYEEIMPGQYIKLTDRTVSRISETLELVASNKLILSKVKAYDLTANSQAPEPVMPEPPTEPAISPVEVNNEYALVRVEAHAVKNPTRLLVHLNNPTKRRLKVSLQDKNGQSFFTESITAEKYARKIDIGGLIHGEYTLIVNSPYRRYPYRYSRQVVVAGSELSIK